MPPSGSSRYSRNGGRRNVPGRRHRIALRAIATAAAFLLALVIFAGPIARFLIVRAEPSGADVVVILSGASVYDERIRHGLSVFQEGRAQTIVLTNDGLRGRWSRRRQANLTSVERAKDAVIDAGIPERHLIVLKPRVNSTYDEALTVHRFAEEAGIRTVLVVTSPYHSRRAMWIFRRVLEPAGVRVGIDSPVPGDQSPRPGAWWLSRIGWQSVALEYVKLVYYRFKHG
jgi:uncharacterized SAM-binding protein YcdF (DUF218 family)